MMKLGLMCNTGPKYSRLKKDEEEYRNGDVDEYKPMELFEAFEVSDTKDAIKDPSGEYNHLRRVAIGISWFSVLFGFITGVTAICLGQIFGSESLFGYGLDAVLDSMSSVAVLWRFYSNCTAEVAESKERKACIVIAIFFFVSSVSLIYKSVRGFVRGNVPEPIEQRERIVSDAFSSVCGVVALCLGTIKVYYGRKLQSQSLLTDSIITFVGAFMSIMSVLSMELHEFDSHIWELDATSGLLCAGFLLIFGMKILIQMTCLYRRSRTTHIPVKDGT